MKPIFIWLTNTIETTTTQNIQWTKVLYPVKKPLLRYDLDLKHQSLTVDNWKHVLFSDETKLNKRGSHGKVWKRPSESVKPKFAKQTVMHDYSVMVWRCFSPIGVGDIYIYI